MGLWVAAIARSAQFAGVISQLLFFSMMFFAGLWLPQQRMPAALHTLADYTPLGAAVQAVQATMQGDFPAARALLVLVAYGVVFAVAAVRCFRWSSLTRPRGATSADYAMSLEALLRAASLSLHPIERDVCP